MMAYTNFWVQLLVISLEHLEDNSLDKSFSINGWETLLQEILSSAVIMIEEKNNYLARSHGLVVKEENSRLSGCWFNSRRWIMDDERKSLLAIT
jgi:hypothetical protein